ncbi:COG1272: Predicted membrane protein hemolysin III homolog [Brachybacterium faecium]|uniref:Predicted membrane protein, hemolysin III n=1 Tax=Brachybacterium faecium (strain ATCC 43885 / DSM 4810 / JCM 11609 / LMG 19847 / NBRC 14762 / NCIMB 9860 / 6-10) TaxID=446465 RepID=C7MEU8_BRAFD|nr:hemolysin III family protein [Brachybacterium faecium]ACU86098.1 predicted membrane protein, hemolysin III [Brachybacterium faecium DSM 4810]SLM95007.1 COG1272: Predicted membrane protein hemolysin III homolog [Brachybacterium faecium]
MDNGHHRDARAQGAFTSEEEVEAAEAVAESGGTRLPSDDDLPTAETFPFAPRTLTRAMARRATQLGLQLPKPRLRGMLHLIAFPTTLVIGLLLVAVGETFATRLACAVFVLTAGMLFGISAVYHRGTWTPQRAIMLRRFDHANIFLIIAGTYTPIAVTLLAPRQALTLLLIAWGGALVGVCFRLFWTAAPRWIYVPAYIALGWVAVFYMPALHAGGGWPVVWLLVIGGLAYTAGAVMYALKRPNPSPAWFGFHEIFHAGTLIGFGCHFAAVAVAVL